MLWNGFDFDKFSAGCSVRGTQLTKVYRFESNASAAVQDDIPWMEGTPNPGFNPKTPEQKMAVKPGSSHGVMAGETIENGPSKT